VKNKGGIARVQSSHLPRQAGEILNVNKRNSGEEETGSKFLDFGIHFALSNVFFIAV